MLTTSRVLVFAALLTLLGHIQDVSEGRRFVAPPEVIAFLGRAAWIVLVIVIVIGVGPRVAAITPWMRRWLSVALGLLILWWTVIGVAIVSHRGFLPGLKELVQAGIFLPPSESLAISTTTWLALLLIGIGVGLYGHMPSFMTRWFERFQRSFPTRSQKFSFVNERALVHTFSFAALGPLIFDLLARQHIERSELNPVTGAVVALDGPLITTFIWTVITTGAISLFALPIISAWRIRLTSQSWHVPSFVSMMTSVIAGGFLIRLGTLLTIAPTRTDGGDPLFYHVTANLLAQGRGFPEPLNYVAYEDWIPSALHGPLYPLVLSLSSRLGGTTYFDHKFLSLLIGTAVVALTALVAYDIAPRRRRITTLMAGSLAAVYSNLWLVDGVLFPEGLMALFTTAVVYVAYRWRRQPTLKAAVALGLLISASALTRGEGLALSVLLVVPWFLTHRDLSWQVRGKHVLITALACIAVLAPWTLRNARSFEVAVPLSTNGNELFVYANCEDVYEGKFLGFWLFSCQEDLRAQGLDAVGDEAQKSLYWREIGISYARDNIADVPRVVAARIGRQWDFFRPWQNTQFAPIEGRNKDAARFGLVQYYAMIPLAAIGVASMRRNRRRIFPLASLFAMVTLTAAYAYGTTRFRVPAEPALCVLAAIGSIPLLERLRRKWKDDDSHALGGEVPRSFVLGSSWRDSSTGHLGRTLMSWFVVLGSVLLALPALFRATGSTMEEGFMLVFPDLVRQGSIANVDFLHLYGPGSLHALAGWFSLFGTNLLTERTFGLLQHLGVIAGLTVLTRPWGRRASTAVGVTTTIFTLSPIGLQALAWPGALALGLWSLIAALRGINSQRSPQVWWAMSGILAGLSLTFRPDLIIALVLGLGGLLWRRRQRVGIFLGSLVVGLVPMWVHFYQAGLRAPVEGMLLDPVFRLRGGRELPQPPSIDRLDGALQVISEKFGPWWSIPHLSAPQQLFLWFFVLPVVAVSIAIVARGMDRHRPERQVLLAAAWFGIGLLPQALQRPDSAHFLWVSCISWPLVIVAGIEMTSRRRPRSHQSIRLLSGTAVIVSLMLFIAPFYTLRTYGDLVVRSLTNDLPVREVRRGDRFFYLGDERPWRASLQVVSALDELAKPGQRLFVGPMDLRQTAYSDVFFYHLFGDLTPATYFIEMDPGLANAVGSRLADDVASADWLILTRFWSGWIEPNDSVVFGSDIPNQIVEQHFCLRSSFQLDLVRLYERCSTGDGIGPYDSPYRPEYDYAVEVRVPVPARPDGTCTPTCWGRPSLSGIEIGIDTSVVEPLK